MKQMKPENEPSGDSFLETMMFDFHAEFSLCTFPQTNIHSWRKHSSCQLSQDGMTFFFLDNQLLVSFGGRAPKPLKMLVNSYLGIHQPIKQNGFSNRLP